MIVHIYKYIHLLLRIIVFYAFYFDNGRELE